MKNKLILSFIALFIVSLTLFSCTDKVKPENVYHASEADLEDGISIISSGLAGYVDTTCCLVKDGDNIKIAEIAADLTLTLHDTGIVIHSGERFSVRRAAADADSLWFVANGMEAVNGDMKYFTRLYRFSGGKLTSVRIDDGEGYVMGLTADGDSALMAYSGRLKRISTDRSVTDYSSDVSYVVNDVLKTKNGLYAFVAANNQDGGMSLVEVTDDSLGDPIPVGQGVVSFIASGAEESLFAVTNAGIDSCDMSDGKIIRTEILDFVSSDIDPDDVTKVAPLSGKRFAAVIADKLCLLSPVPKDQLTEKEIIRLATVNPGKIRSKIIAFNKRSEDYHLTLIDYSESEDGARRLSADLVSKNQPDILVVSPELDFDGFARMKLFTDLYRFINTDRELRDDLAANVLKAYEKDGKLTSIVNRFDINTFAAKKKLLGDITDFTTESFVSFADTHEISMFADSIDRAKFLSTYVAYNRDRLTKEGFTDDELRLILDFAKSLPEGGEGGFFRDDEQYTEERVLLSDEIIMGYYSYNSAKNLTFGGDDAVYVGFPTVEGGVRGLIAKSSIDYELAILANSKHKNGAWEFIKYLLSEEEQLPTQNSSGGWVMGFSLPIRVSAIEKLFEISKDELPMLSFDELSMTKEFILSVDHLYREDEDIFSILYEDASVYFSDAKTLDETIEIIRDRVGTLLSERKF